MSAQLLKRQSETNAACYEDSSLVKAEDTSVESQPEPTPPYSSFTTWQTRVIILGAALTALFAPLTSQIYLPSLQAIARDFNVSIFRMNLTITAYVISQGITPAFIGSLADSGGRRIAYLVCFTIYIAATIGLALAPNYGSLLGLRFVQSTGSSSTNILCASVVADLVTSAQRGQYIGFTIVPSVLGPALGPVIGGLLSQNLGWRSIFWFLTIMASLAITLIIIFFPETCRGIVGDGSIYPPRLHQSMWQVLRRRNKPEKPWKSDDDSTNPPDELRCKLELRSILNSLFILMQRETAVLLWTTSLVFAGNYFMSTAMPTLLSERYGFNQVQVGLLFLPQAAGSIGAACIAGPLMNWNFRRHCAKRGIPFDPSRHRDLSGFPIERVRLEIGFPLVALGGACIIGWGWAMHSVANIAVLCVLSVLISISIVGHGNTAQALLVDIHPGKTGAAAGANNMTRCLVGAGASAAIKPMMQAMGVGWAFTLIGGLFFLCCAPLLVIILYGMEWRTNRTERT